MFYFRGGNQNFGAQLGRLADAGQVSAQGMWFSGRAGQGIPILICSSDFGVHLISCNSV